MDEAGVPLRHYLDQHPEVDIMISCPCGFTSILAMAGVVARLTARGVEAREVGVRSIAALVNRACPRCGALAWRSGPHWPTPKMGAGTREEQANAVACRSAKGRPAPLGRAADTGDLAPAPR